MPYGLIRKLKNLMAMDFTVPSKSKDIVLGGVEFQLPEDALDAIDNISAYAREIFGPNIKPTQQQLHIMQTEGFPIEAARSDLVGWKKGAINTPKGAIHYS